MKTIYALLVVFLSAVGISAQTLPETSNAPKLEVVQKKWGSEVRIPVLDEDPLRPHKELERASREREEAERQRRITRQQQRLEPTPIPTRPPQTRSNTVSIIYVYETKVRNGGEKEIQALVWDYVFFEPGTEREVGRQRFLSKANIPPGKTKNLVMRSPSPPTGAISAREAGKKLRQQYAEQIVIQGVEYADGSVWQAVPNK